MSGSRNLRQRPPIEGSVLSRTVRVAASLIAAMGVLATAACATTGGSLLSTTDLSRQELQSASDQFQSVYEYLRAHSRVSFVTSGGQTDEIMFVYGRGQRSLSYAAEGGAYLYVNNDEVPDPVPILRSTPMSEVETLQILRASETSARFGGAGRRGSVVITTVGG